MLTRAQVAPGVTVVVPRGADVTRQGLTYRLRVVEAYDSTGDDLVFVGGMILRADGTPSTRRYGYRAAHLELAALELAPVPAGKED